MTQQQKIIKNKLGLLELARTSFQQCVVVPTSQ
jgi:hypothetical protein